LKGMKAQMITAATLLTVFCGTLPAVDTRLLNLVMPDAKVFAGVNVAQAKTSPFGQYVLAQMQAQAAGLNELATITGFDPRQDVNEIFAASSANPNNKGGLALATGTFNVATITNFALQQKATTETYKGVTIIEDPKMTHGVAFLNANVAVAGDIADVKGAIDRQSSATALPPTVAAMIGQLSTSEDAWVLSTVPPSSLHAPASAPAIPGFGAGAANGTQNVLATIQQGSAGVRFGTMVAFTAQLQADTAQNATSVAAVLQFLANMAQMQMQQNSQAAALAQSLSITATGTTVNIAASIPSDQFQQFLQQGHRAARQHPGLHPGTRK
jgi:hypothetical protein